MPYAPDLSLFLNHSPDPADLKEWHACVQFALVMSNPHDKIVHTSRSEISMPSHTSYVLTGSNCRFNSQSTEWGFRNFSTVGQLLAVQEPHTRSIIENDLVDITAFVRVVNDHSAMLWYDFAE